MRTGSVGNRSAEDMVKTLVEPKKQVISSIRMKLLAEGFSEEVEYDAINIEPVLIYSKSEKKVVLVKHKWETCASIPIQVDSELDEQKGLDLSKYLTLDDEGNRWLKFRLPEEEASVIEILQKID